MVLFVLRKLVLQTHMYSHLVGLDVWFLVEPFIYFHTSCVRTAKALARLLKCADLPQPSLVTYVISTIISWAGSWKPFLLKNHDLQHDKANKKIRRITRLICVFDGQTGHFVGFVMLLLIFNFSYLFHWHFHSLGLTPHSLNIPASTEHHHPNYLTNAGAVFYPAYACGV